MIKIVLDTNVAISSVIAEKGKPAVVFERIIKGDVINYTSKEIIEEIKEVINRPKIRKYISKQQSGEFIGMYKKVSITIKPTVSIQEIEEDPDDDKFLECAIEADVDYIISGDPHLTNIENYKEINIVTPKQFLEKVDFFVE